MIRLYNTVNVKKWYGYALTGSGFYPHAAIYQIILNYSDTLNKSSEVIMMLSTLIHHLNEAVFALAKLFFSQVH